MAGRRSGFVIHVALVEPEIPPNTGNIARLCAAACVPLHIVGYPAFQISDKAAQRAGLDYWPHVQLHRHGSLAELEAALPGVRLLFFTTKVQQSYHQFCFQENDCLVFGPETRGLPETLLQAHPDRCLTIPMASPHVRSLNLATSAGIALYEALRQLGALDR